MNRYFFTYSYFISICLFFACSSPNPSQEFSTSSSKQDKFSSTVDTESVIATPPATSSPQKAQYYYKQAHQTLQNKDTAQAINQLERAFHLNPSFLPAINLLGILYAEKGNAKSLSLLKKILHSSKNKHTKAKTYFYQGIYYKQRKMLPQALQMWDKSILTDWTFLDAYLEKGAYYFKTNHIIQAKKAFQLAYRINNHNPEIYYWLGRIAENEGNTKTAAACYQNALLLDPTFKAVQNRLHSLFQADQK